jgi:hypothetical protein
MEKECPDTSVLDNCQITLVGQQMQQENYLTRTIIQISGDITPYMAHLSRVIKDCGYHPDGKTIAFRIWDMPVVIHSDYIVINNMRDLETAHKFLKWLKNKMIAKLDDIDITHLRE